MSSFLCSQAVGWKQWTQEVSFIWIFLLNKPNLFTVAWKSTHSFRLVLKPGNTGNSFLEFYEMFIDKTFSLIVLFVYCVSFYGVAMDMKMFWSVKSRTELNLFVIDTIRQVIRATVKK